MPMYVAVKLGFYKATRQRPGDIFEAPENFKAKWAKPVGSEPAPVLQVAEDEPRTLSEMGRQKSRRPVPDSII